MEVYLQIESSLKQGNVELALAIVDQHADQDEFAATVAAYMCITYSQVSAFKELINRGVSPNATAWTESLLAYAARGCSVEIVRFLLETGADVNQRCQRGMSPLFSCFLSPRAQTDARLAVASLLLEFGAEINVSDHSGLPLVNLAAHREPNALPLLIRHGADVNRRWALNTKNVPQCSPLRCAIKSGNLSLLQILLDHGSDPNSCFPEDSEYTASNVALEYHQFEALRLLLDHGAKPWQADTGDLRAIVNAYNPLTHDPIRVLLQIGIAPDTLMDMSPYHLWHIVAEQPEWKELLDALVALGYDPCQMDGNRGCLLTHAIAHGRWEVAHHVLDAIAHSGKRELLSGSILESALVSGNREITSRILDFGIDPNDEDWTINYALAISIERNWMDAFEAILALGGDINSALEEAARHGRSEMAQVLISRGANLDNCVELLVQYWIDVGTKHSVLARPGYVQGDYATTLSLLQEASAEIDNLGEDQRGAIMTAIWADRDDVALTVIPKLCELGSAIDYHDRNGWTALMQAASMGKTKTARLLVEMGASVNTSSLDGESALNIARRFGYSETVQFLKENGATVPATAVNTLHGAILWGHTEDALSLIEGGAHIEQKDRHGRTPLIAALENDDTYDVACALVAAGANVNPDSYTMYESTGPTPLAIACGNLWTEGVTLLIQHGADVNGHSDSSPLLSTIERDLDREIPIDAICAISSLLIDAGADVNLKGYLHDTPLHMAARFGNARLIEMLIDAGADVNAQRLEHPNACYGQTPLHEAARGISLDAMLLLLHRGADPNAADQCGAAPLIYAVNPLLLDPIVDEDIRIEFVETLIRFGAQIDAVDSLHRTALSVARENGYHQVAERLVTLGATEVGVSSTNKVGVVISKVVECPQNSGW